MIKSAQTTLPDGRILWAASCWMIDEDVVRIVAGWKNAACTVLALPSRDFSGWRQSILAECDGLGIESEWQEPFIETVVMGMPAAVRVACRLAYEMEDD
jgi:hypothetical protein